MPGKSKASASHKPAKPPPASRRSVKRKPTTRKPARGTDHAVSTNRATINDFLDNLNHPLRSNIDQLRRDMRTVDPQIVETLKWNSLSFRRDDDFATLNRRSLDAIQLIFHTGAKTKASAKIGLDLPSDIADSPMIKWLAKDRALVTLGAGATFTRHRTPFKSLVRAWLKAM